ncbi:MAG: trigger factor [Clostridia bacterium]|nr:trigger factor [Clostridia bacterium]
MASTVETLENKQVKLTITVPYKEFDEAVQKAYLKIRKNIMVPGFRKGKVPRQVVQNHYGEEIFYEDALEIIVPPTYEAALKEHNVDDVDSPEYNVDQIGKNQDLIYTATVTVKPEVTLGKYKGKSIKVYKKNITAKDVDAEIKKEADKIARLVEVEGRSAQKDDTANIDYSGSIDGEEFAGGSAQGYDLILGSDSFIPGFEDQVIGMNIGEEKDIKVTFPEEYQSDDLKGKDAVFKVKLNTLKTKELPALDDEFAKDVSEFDTLAEYKADIKANLEKQAESEFETESQNKIVELLVKDMQADIPDCMIDRQTDYTMREIDYNFKSQGFSLEQYIQMTGMTIDAFKEQYKDQSLEQVKAQLALEAVQKLENLEVVDEDIDAEFAKLAEETKRTLEDVKKTFAGSGMDYIKENILARKTMDLLKEQITVEATSKKDKPKNND